MRGATGNERRLKRQDGVDGRECNQRGGVTVSSEEGDSQNTNRLDQLALVTVVGVLEEKGVSGQSIQAPKEGDKDKEKTK